jgi:Cu/Ag efflux protein CusF
LRKTGAAKYVLIAILVVFYVVAKQQGFSLPGRTSVGQKTETTLQTVFRAKQSDVQVQGKGVVKKILADDRKGSQHQKFILQVNPEQTVLVAHNIDVAARLPGLKGGDSVEFYGEYEWTAQGGVIHWTHHDRRGRHINGWLKYNGKVYQ